MKVTLDGTAADKRRAYQVFQDANTAFFPSLQAFQKNLNNVVGNQATKKRGHGGGNGFDAYSLVQLQRIAVSLESKVEMETLVS